MGQNLGWNGQLLDDNLSSLLENKAVGHAAPSFPGSHPDVDVKPGKGGVRLERRMKIMRNRKRQRANRRRKEEHLEARNCYDLQDPTPRQAMQNMLGGQVI